MLSLKLGSQSRFQLKQKIFVLFHSPIFFYCSCYENTIPLSLSPSLCDMYSTAPTPLSCFRWAWCQLCPIWWWQSSCRSEASWPTTWEPTTWWPPPMSGSWWTVEVRDVGGWGGKRKMEEGGLYTTRAHIDIFILWIFLPCTDWERRTQLIERDPCCCCLRLKALIYSCNSHLKCSSCQSWNHITVLLLHFLKVRSVFLFHVHKDARLHYGAL